MKPGMPERRAGLWTFLSLIGRASISRPSVRPCGGPHARLIGPFCISRYMMYADDHVGVIDASILVFESTHMSHPGRVSIQTCGTAYSLSTPAAADKYGCPAAFHGVLAIEWTAKDVRY